MIMLTGPLAALALVVCSCGRDTTTSAPTSAAVTTAATAAPATTTPATTTPATTTPATTTPATTTPATAAPATTAPATTAPASVVTETPTTVAPSTTVPDALQSIDGVAALQVTVGGADSTRPTFAWAAPANAVSYQLVVQTSDGTPLWAWSGADTNTVLGGVERAADVEGPTLTGPSRVRVYAFGADSALVAVSGWVGLTA